ncbi:MULTISPECIES: aspartate carbamoyltransferase regulatory subunit [Aquitalea]|jgi:aspartate carbamoyltransferase regulatory subunit|uniref:Aspartate carbamoyltransferase regulatory chain n=3 Tax=Aquitalea TaxID=407217 RepID=A0A318JFZ8_9NEIS|nr:MULTISPECIES: aspartate carbamoyltransferase regulatory subunit [Aquitalea]MBA4708322.1 aspartate carbamoyltransferase regulatory subunit [Aquitalea magnusonii]PXX46250.1 aspartate carbamoyltransferase regulatory subunit [Aquitalea magnusonii]RMD00202.1 aspartate carbamoyltransferase regulatory subunit [Aquitalea palustris]
MQYTRTVEALKQGTVIDHIPAGQGVNILRLFKLAETGERITVGLNLSSRHMGAKDIIKVENVALTEEQANELALFAPKATVNVIDNFEVVKKHKLELPESIEGIFACPNSNCISHAEPVKSHFFVKAQAKDIKMKCKYCEKVFSKDIVAVVR